MPTLFKVNNIIIFSGMPNRALSTSLASANIKSLRLFRYICRILPFVLKTHEVYLFIFNNEI
jgi:hypothetical protein